MKQLVCITPKNFKYQEGIKLELTEGNAIIKVKRIGICGTDLHAYEGTQAFLIILVFWSMNLQVKL
jgi:threonine dehydrogenase-like Zn-dependent dehydrogenase